MGDAAADRAEGPGFETGASSVPRGPLQLDRTDPAELETLGVFVKDGAGNLLREGAKMYVDGDRGTRELLQLPTGTLNVTDLPHDVRELLVEESQVTTQLGGPGLVNVESLLDWLLEKVVDCEAEAAKVTSVSARRQAMIRGWEQDELVRIHRQRVHLLGRITENFPREVEAFQRAWHTKKKSLSLPNGTLGFEKDREKVEILDQPKAQAWCKENGVQVKVKEEAQLTPIKDYVVVTGDVPDPELHGIRWTPAGGDRFYCRPSKRVVE